MNQERYLSIQDFYDLASKRSLSLYSDLNTSLSTLTPIQLIGATLLVCLFNFIYTSISSSFLNHFDRPWHSFKLGLFNSIMTLPPVKILINYEV